MDRNFRNVYDFPVCVVALRKESVDRNINCIVPHAVKIWSLSARRAWIEIPFLLTASSTLSVALRKESVDRNLLSQIAISETLLSLSARRAWIEIRQGLVYAVLVGVALRKESVDRNVWVDFFQRFHYSRSPQGERG